MKYKFFDTSSLLLLDSLEDGYQIAISTITLQELESLKSCRDANKKYLARQTTKMLVEHLDQFEIVIFTQDMLTPFIQRDLEITNDIKILASAFYLDSLYPDEVTFVTNDLALQNIANLFFGEDSIESIEVPDEEYKGFEDVMLTDAELEYFYSHLEENQFGLYINEYLVIRNTEGEIVDWSCWNGKMHRCLRYRDMTSKQFGKVRPLSGDIWQQFAVDSFNNNKITLLTGRPGSGKSLMSLSYLVQQLEQGTIDKIVIFCNPVAVRGAARLGYYPGDRLEKLLDSQIGNFLTSKFGGRFEVERLIQQEKILLLPMADIRGFDTTGLRAGIYITEAQNMSVDLMKLALQRIGEDCICIIEGDNKTQVDMEEYAGQNNGMRRMSEVFRGQDYFGQVELQLIHRSRIAKTAELM